MNKKKNFNKIQQFFTSASLKEIAKVAGVFILIHFIVMIIIALVPVSFDSSFEFVKNFFSEVNKYILRFSGLLGGGAVAILTILLKSHANLVKRISIFFLTAIIVNICSYGVSGICSVVYESIGNSETDVSEPQTEPNNDITSVPIEQKVIFDIGFDDPLLKAFDIEVIKEYKNELIEQISEKLFSKIEINANADYDEYEKYVNEAYDFEQAYIYYTQEGLFETHHQEERTDKINKSIELRKIGDNYYVFSENQKLIAYRYIELAHEYSKLSKVENMTESYNNAVYWLLTAIQTAYSEDDSNSDIIAEMLSDVISCYNNIMEIYDSESDEYMRAEVMSEIYTTIKNSYT